jgi:signal transduction histidine kinase
MPRLLLQLLLILAAIALMLAAPILYLAAAGAQRQLHSAVADACAAEVRLAERRDAATVGETIERLKRRYNLAGIGVLAGSAEIPEQSLNRQYRTTETMNIRIDFSPAAARLGLAVTVAGIGSAAMLVLLLINVLSAVRPGAQASEAAAEQNLFRTFGLSIRTLQQESERERERAAELETVTQTLVRSITSGIIAIDGSGLLVDINTTARQLLGVPDESSVEGRTVADALGDNEFSRLLQGSVDRRESLQRVETTAGEGSMLGLTTVPLFDSRHRYLGMLALFTDLVPVRRLESRLREMHALADLGEMSAGIAHELRNSLGTVLGYLQLAGRSDLPPEALERVQRAEKEARQLNTAMDSFLAYARPMRMQISTIELRAAVTEIVNDLRPLAAGIQFDVDGTPAQIHGDRSLLARAFGNVLRNSIEAIAERGGGGKITIRVASQPAPTVTIADDGIGIRSDLVARLFLPFQSTKTSGSGLGLALAKKIVVLHGGSIQLTARANGGALATFDFPPLAESPLRASGTD